MIFLLLFIFLKSLHQICMKKVVNLIVGIIFWCSMIYVRKYLIFILFFCLDLHASLMQCQDLDGILDVHNRYISKIYDRCFLHPSASVLKGNMSKSTKIWLSKSIFYVKIYRNLSHFFFIEEYQFRSTFIVNDNFW